MQNQVIADIEIEDQKIEHYSSVIINQKFNEHHTFSIRIKYDVLENAGSFGLNNAQKFIGKAAVIKFLDADTLEAAYEFHGLVCEISVEQSDNFSSDLIIKGYSPTILLENGPNLNSFYNKKLQDIVSTLTKSLSSVNCGTSINPQYKNQITYISQYRESTFHFLNRLSSQFGEWLFYDGQKLNFGKPSKSTSVEITYGVDMHTMQMKLRILPLTFSGYSYISKDDKFISSDAPKSVDGLDQYASYALNESNKIFSEPVSLPVKQRITAKSDLDAFLKQQKISMAADLEVLSATSDNPAICIGAIADVKISERSENDYTKGDGGKFLITSVEHYLTDKGRYTNSFEGISSGIDVIPVNNIIVPIAEPQIAIVKDNKDPDNMGRVRVQMLWQEAANVMTEWLRVMTPDAGGGKDGAKNRGLVVVPEPGDQVLVCFRYNDPDRPFVLGSMFHGKTGGGGGSGNNTKSLTSKSGHTVTLDDGKGITIVDKSGGNKIDIDGTNTINITSSQKIVLSNGTSSLTMDGSKITLTSGSSTLTLDGAKTTLLATNIDMEGKSDAKIHSGPASFSAASGGDAKIDGTNVAATATAEAKINGTAQITINSPGIIDIKGAMIKKNG